MTDDVRRISVVIAEDHRDLRYAIGALVAAEPDMRVTGIAARNAELLAMMRATSAQVLVLDLFLDGESSVPALRQLLAQQPQLAVVIYSGHERATITAALEPLRRCEYVTKSGDPAPLLEAIRRAAGTGSVDGT